VPPYNASEAVVNTDAETPVSPVRRSIPSRARSPPLWRVRVGRHWRRSRPATRRRSGSGLASRERKRRAPSISAECCPSAAGGRNPTG
jgi:hypothetical protein